MKKIVIGLCFILLLAGFVFAVNNQGIQAQDGTGAYHEAVIAAGGQGNATQSRVVAGDYTGQKGERIQLKEKENKRIQLRVGNVSADCGCNMTQERIQNRTKLNIKLSNGRNAEVKVMPDTASENALQRLRLKVCSEENNCTLELKEVGKGNQTRAVYELKTRRNSKFLGLFKTRMNVQAQVDSETGEIFSVKKPWWAFLATEPLEK